MAVTPSQTSLPTVQYLLEQQAERGLHLGAQVYVSRGGEVVADLAAGQARPGVPMTPQTANLWMSCTKPVTAIALARQMEEHAIPLDTPVAELVPAFAANDKQAITLEHLLTHTAGLRPTPFRFPEDDWDTIVSRICAMAPEPGWVPGEQAGYHVFSTWFMLAEIVQRLSGEAFSYHVRTQLFEPLDMDDSWLGIPPTVLAESAHRLGHLYDTTGDVPQDTPMNAADFLTHCNPGGNAVGPANQLGRFFEMLLTGGRYGGARLLQRETVARFTCRRRRGMFDQTFKHTIDWGLGFIINSAHHGPATVPYGFGPHASPDTFGHGGRQSSVAFADPKHDLAVVIVCNGMPGEAKHHKRMRDLCSAIYTDLHLAPST